jgi:DNA-binding transcriptional LysR family regulator
MDFQPVWLRTLIEIEHRGSMTAAAAALGYTTGAVSQQMAALANAAGTDLFERVGRGVRLTDSGSELARHGRKLLEVHRELRELLESEGAVTGTVTVGAFSSAAVALLPRTLQAVTRLYPEVRVRTTAIDVDDAAPSVARGDVDLALGLDYDSAPIPRNDQVVLTRLRTERFGLATKRRSDVRPTRLRDARDAQWILPPEPTYYGRAVRMACRREGFEPNVAHSMTETATSLAMVQAGLGVTTATEIMRQLRPQGIVLVPLLGSFSRSIVLVRHSASRRHSVTAVAEAISVGLRDAFPA